MGLCDHFSSCGEVTYVDTLSQRPSERHAAVCIIGQGCVEKAKERSERNAQGWNIVVDFVPSLRGPEKRKPTGCNPFTVRAKMDNAKKAKMEKMEKKKNTTE
ncbi:uncharacterized protein LOC17876059 [Capsella rubella]|nr:uncharacterized protein LOC17876059 [Capsella rubella]